MSAADELRALTDAATPGPWRESGGYVWSNEHPARVALACSDADAELIVWLRNHADALANLIDAASAVLENGEPPYSWPVYAAREMRDALAALIGGAR